MPDEQKPKLQLEIGRLLFLDIARRKVDPVWKPFRNDPGFKQLLKMKQRGRP